MCTIILAPIVYACGCVGYIFVRKVACEVESPDVCQGEVIDYWYSMNSPRNCSGCH